MEWLCEGKYKLFVLRSETAYDIAFCLYLRYGLFHILDHFSLMSIFHRFTFCTTTCQLNGICWLCSRVVPENLKFTEKCRLMLKDVKLIDVFNKDITAMFQNLKRWFHKFNISNTMILYVLTKLINKYFSSNFSKLVTIKKMFVSFSRKYLYKSIWI